MHKVDKLTLSRVRLTFCVPRTTLDKSFDFLDCHSSKLWQKFCNISSFHHCSALAEPFTATFLLWIAQYGVADLKGNESANILVGVDICTDLNFPSFNMK